MPSYAQKAFPFLPVLLAVLAVANISMAAMGVNDYKRIANNDSISKTEADNKKNWSSIVLVLNIIFVFYIGSLVYKGRKDWSLSM